MFDGDDGLLLWCTHYDGHCSCVVVLVHAVEDASGSGRCSCVQRCAHVCDSSGTSSCCVCWYACPEDDARRQPPTSRKTCLLLSFVVDGDFTSGLLLASAALASVGINMKRRWPAVAASAAAPDDRYVHDCLFVSSGVLVSLLLMTPAAAFVGISVKMHMYAVAASAAASGDVRVSEVLFAIVGLCHVLVICWNILVWPSCASGVLEMRLSRCSCTVCSVRVRNKAIHSAK